MDLKTLTQAKTNIHWIKIIHLGLILRETSTQAVCDEVLSSAVVLPDIWEVSPRFCRS